MAKFRVALSGDFVKADGSPTFPMFDLATLRNEPNVEVDYVAPVDGVMPAAGLAGHDALILLTPKFNKSSVPADGRLAIVARFGVGYDSVDVEACTAAGIALAITPDGVRRPVAAAILTFILALAGKMMIKDKLTRGGPPEFAKKTQHMGIGLVGRTLGSVGIGNIGAEMFRLCKPLDMKFIAHDPFADRKVADSLGVRLVDLETVFRESDFVTVNCPLMPETTPPGERRAAGADEADGLFHQYRARPDRRPEGAHQGAAGAAHRRRRPRRVRPRAAAGRRSHPEARQRHPGAARPVLDRPVLCRHRRLRRQGRARRHARPRSRRHRQSRDVLASAAWKKRLADYVRSARSDLAAQEEPRAAASGVQGETCSANEGDTND